MPGERYSRNEALFGVEGQRKIAATRVAILGLGGLGSHIAQQLAYLGVASYALIDQDVVTESSLNRLIGAVDADIEAKTEKVKVAKRMIEAINPAADAKALCAKLDASEAETLISEADVVFACLDRDLARLQATVLCSRYAKPCFDLASDTGEEDDQPWYGGRVIFCDGSRCLVCLGLLDQEEMRRESKTPAQREAHERIYGVRQGALAGTGPMVVSVNGVVASIAITEFMVLRTGMRELHSYLIYHGAQQVIRHSLDTPESGCYYCDGTWGSALGEGAARPSLIEIGVEQLLGVGKQAWLDGPALLGS